MYIKEEIINNPISRLRLCKMSPICRLGAIPTAPNLSLIGFHFYLNTNKHASLACALCPQKVPLLFQLTNNGCACSKTTHT